MCCVLLSIPSPSIGSSIEYPDFFKLKKDSSILFVPKTTPISPSPLSLIELFTNDAPSPLPFADKSSQ